MSDTQDFWAGEFGDAYLTRNRVDWRARIPFWDKIISYTGSRSVFEVGANAGWNLSAIKHSISCYNISTYGCEVNELACRQSRIAGLDVENLDGVTCLDGYDKCFDLVYTVGVLIHIAPSELREVMQSIIDASCDYVLAVEYAADQEEEVLYRGHEGKLWKRPYGKIYQDMGLTLVKEFDAGEGFDRCTAWLLKK